LFDGAFTVTLTLPTPAEADLTWGAEGTVEGVTQAVYEETSPDPTPFTATTVNR
jgi:hypothetical protein